jgi:hypothetical protein
VYLVVLGLLLMVFESFGDDPHLVTTPVDADEVEGPAESRPEAPVEVPAS